MGASNFKIYSASAGSGKTYSLTKAYLKLLLSDGSPSRFRQLLAITFTNKAVGEMKSRILENLYDFDTLKDEESQSSLFTELCEDLSLSSEQLRQRAKLILKRILHNYSFFEVSTIDKFNHKLIKTFAQDLQLAQNFEVELETELLLEEAIGQLLERAGNDAELTKVLIAFSLEKIDDNKSWDIVYDLMEIGKLLFQENHFVPIEKLSSKSIKDFTAIQNKIVTVIKSIEGRVTHEAERVLKSIDDLGFAHTDFPRQTLPNHFKKIVAGEFNTKSLYNNRLEQNLLENKVLKSSDNRNPAQLTNMVLTSFLSIKKKLFQRSYLKNIYGNMVPLTVLNEIAKEIKNIEIEKDIIPISSLNTLLSKEIKDQPIPFIYERMGEKYRHYFIDEFQDTSRMQWENLIPLIGNALEGESEKKETGSLFLVGDVKQAIYRWRGGKAEQFLNLINGRSHPFVIEPDIQNLDTNWRSQKNIVDFNNTFFTSVAPYLQDEDYQKLFLDGAHQKAHYKNGGFVQLTFLEADKENKEEAHCNEVLKTIHEVTSKKYRYEDICILVRKNEYGLLLANFLSENGIPIISSESLLLKNSSEVSFLISLLRLMENPNDHEAAYEVLLFLGTEAEDKHDFISKNMDSIWQLLSTDYGFHSNRLKELPVFNIIETAIVQFELAPKAPAFLTFLMDEVLVVEKREGPGIHSFLRYWEQKKDNLSIAAPDSINAVKIMTIHKAKGLEFPIVLFPFANAVINDQRKKKKSWVKASEEDMDLGLETFLISTKQEMLQYNETSAEAYLDEIKKTELDAFNVLYVALTRAKKGLFVISEKAKEIGTLEQASSYAHLFQYFLNEKGFPINEKGHYTFGELSENQLPVNQPTQESQYIPYITRQKNDAGFTISTRSVRLWDEKQQAAIEMGNLIHFALSYVFTADDVAPVLENLQAQGHFNEEQAPGIRQKINAVVNHPQLKDYYSDSYQILNEREILTVDGTSLRPDRLAISGNEVTIIDYKTGKPSPSHKEQLAQYADELKAMDFEIKHTIIVYIDHEIKPVFL